MVMCSRIVFAASVLSFPSWDQGGDGFSNSFSASSLFGEAAIFDVKADPLETNDLTGQAAIATEQAELTARLAFWGSSAVPPLYESSISDSVAAVWEAAGGVVPFTDSYDNEPPKPIITSVPAAEGAPNIVFVLLDDVGYMDLSYHETSWMPDATPNLKKLAAESVELTQYYTAHLCAPTRSSFLTGRYAVRTGFWQAPRRTNLPEGESLIGEELKALGYRTAMVGKWHMGFELWRYTPLHRGFDYYYGYYFGEISYDTKQWRAAYPVDLHDGSNLVTDATELSTHLTHLLDAKAKAVVVDHALNHASSKPLFLYYAPQNNHDSFDGYPAPQEYIDRCSSLGSRFLRERQYCALTVMIDESIGNLLCTLKDEGLGDNTLFVVTSDNGGVADFAGSNFPMRGAKTFLTQGGVRNTALVHGTMVPESRRGQVYDGLVHVTDWFPSFINLATPSWSGVPRNGYPIDGHDVLDAILSGEQSPRFEVLHNHNAATGESAVQLGSLKLIEGGEFGPTNLENQGPVSSTPPAADCASPWLDYFEVAEAPTVSPSSSNIPTFITGFPTGNPPTLAPTSFAPPTSRPTFTPTPVPPTKPTRPANKPTRRGGRGRRTRRRARIF